MRKKKQGIAAFFPVLIFGVFIFAFPVRCEAQQADKVEIKGLYSIEKKEFSDVFGVDTGGLQNEETVRNAIKRTFLKGLFDDISVKVSDGETRTVEIQAREKDFIKKIYVEGDHQLSGKLIRGLFLLKEEEVMRYDLLQQAVKELKDKFARYGFPAARIHATVVRTDRPYRVNVRLVIDAGEPLIIKTIQFILNPLYSPAKKEGEAAADSVPDDFSSVMRLSPGDIYDQNRLEEDLKRIREYFKRQGYFSPSVGPHAFADGELRIDVDPGRRLVVVFDGNRAFSARDLLKEIPFFEIEAFNDELVGESIDRMVSLYHGDGHPFAQIAPVIISDDSTITVTFFIFEGERIKVRSISFLNATLPLTKLKGVMSIEEGEVYNPEFIARDREFLKEFYGALGYLEANVRDISVKLDEQSNTVDIVVEVEEGNSTEISSLEILGVSEEIMSRLQTVIGIRPGDPYNEVDISDARFRVIEYYANFGYSNADVIIIRKIQNYGAAVIFKVVEGERKVIGKTIITGNKKTRYEVIKRELLHKEDQPYSFQTLAEDRRRLYKLGLFTDIEIEALAGEGDSKDILIKVNEGNAGSVEFGFGYAEAEMFRSFVEVSYRNLWGMNRQGLLRTELSSLERRYILQYNEPWFLGRPLPFRAFFLHENKRVINVSSEDTRYRLSRYTVTAGVEKKMSDTMKAELYYEFSLVRTSEVQPDVVLTKEDTGTLSISSIKPALVFDTRDNPFDPQKGVLAGIALKVASPLLFSETNFTKLTVYGSSFHRVNKWATLALSLRGGAAYNFGDTQELPLVERLFLGGRSTVRGYEQDTLGPKGSDGNPTGGNAFFMGNIELRTSVGRGIGLVPFLDFGNAWRKIEDINPADLKYTTGLGLRYATPVGPLRVDYGIKLNREADESRGEVHFSVGHAF